MSEEYLERLEEEMITRVSYRQCQSADDYDDFVISYYFVPHIHFTLAFFRQYTRRRGASCPFP